MKQTNRFWKFTFSMLLAVVAVISGILFSFWQTLNPEQTLAIISIVKEHDQYIAGILCLCAGLLFAGLQAIFYTYVKPIKKMSAEASMIYSSNPSHRINIKGIKDVRNLSGVINDFADIFENLNKDITEQILTARKEIEKERNILAAIMAELPQGVIICNKSGRILLFNSLAKKIFTQDTYSKRTEHFIGLGRSIFHLIDKELIAHAVEEIEEHMNSGDRSVESYFITPIQSGHLISIETIPVLDRKNMMTGFILTLQDVTDAINQYDITHAQILSLKKDLVTQAHLIRKCIKDPSILVSTDHTSDIDQIHETIDRISLKYDEVSDVILDSILTPLPLTKLFLPDFLAAVQQKIKYHNGIDLSLSDQPGSDRILADTYSFSAAVIFLIQKVSNLAQTHVFNLSTQSDGKTVIIKIVWQGVPFLKEAADSILSKRINALPSLFYVMKQNKASIQIISDDTDHCTEINIITHAELKSPIKRTLRSPVIAGSRPEFYDFNLFRTDDEAVDLLDTRLDKITYTVFDTETTGLNPDGGDEIVSIAGVRIVNNRIVYQDIFEELVDPKRDIPMESYKIHGINYEMVTGKKEIADILPVFKRFTLDTVLLGHNIAFDMKMLKVKEKTTGIRFRNPVLDTLLLSAVLHPIHEQHDMENIAKRLGVNIIGRHTALGDSIATAEIFLKLLPILNGNGILTLKDAIKASKKTYYARLKY